VRSSAVKRLASECGFELAGVAPALPLSDAERFLDWVSRGMAGQMGYLTDHRAQIRTDPRHLLPSARSIICVAKSYFTGEHRAEDCTRGWISRYARAEDYHELLRRQLGLLAERLHAEFGDFEFRICADTAPLLERSYAREAGLGWIGRNTCLINQQQGSYIFLGEMLVSLELEPDTPAPYRCGTCTRCVDACPTDALISWSDGTQLDARRCISYFTIELRGGMPEEARGGVGHHIFGCDICQEVCPWNRKAPVTDDPALAPLFEGLVDLERLACMTPEEFRAAFRGTPVWRTKYSGFLRNVAIAMGNSGDERFRQALKRLSDSADPVVAEHASWALERLDVREVEFQ
jgi:epoxyqueuosine reductase